MNYGVQVSEYAGKKIGLYGGKFLPLHKGHMQCILEAQSYVDILFVVVGYDEAYEKALCTGTNFDWISPRVRERWLSKELKGFKNIRVLSQYERRSENFMDDPLIAESYAKMLVEIGGHVHLVFSSEPSYEAYFKQYVPAAKHVVIDPERSNCNVSATRIRQEGVYQWWAYLPRAVREYYVKRVAVCGIESVGKSHVSKMLAIYFDTHVVEEYGRFYYDNMNGFAQISEPSDYEEIAVGHVHLINQAQERANKLLIIDTDLCYTQFFHALETARVNQVIEQLIQSRTEKIDAYLYIEPYNAHELDGTRGLVTEQERLQLNERLKAIYKRYGIELISIDEPNRDTRFLACIEAIQGLLKAH